MAIIFNKTIPADKLCLAYNNNVLDFTTDNVLDVINCQITINGTTIILYPHPNKIFYLNLKQYITSFLNVDNFTDDLDVEMSTTSFYDWTDKVFLNTDIEIQINFIDLSNEIELINASFLSGFLQLNNRQIIDSTELFVLTPQIDNKAFLKVWQHYPIDFSLYNPNNTETISFSFNGVFEILSLIEDFTILRTILSDGLYMTFVGGELNYDIVIKSDDVPKFTYNVVQTTPKCDNGVYIKWVNSLGGYSYWLFENWESNQQTKDLGEINNDYNNLEDTLSKSIQIGKTSQNRINVATDVINEQEQLLLSDLFDSPKIYWFIGTPNAVNNFNDWTEISLVTSSISKESTKRNLNNFTLTFELPTNDTRTI